MVELASCTEPTVFQGAIPAHLCTVEPWLALTAEVAVTNPWCSATFDELRMQVTLLLPGKNSEDHNAFSTKRHGWESGFKQAGCDLC